MVLLILLFGANGGYVLAHRIDQSIIITSQRVLQITPPDSPLEFELKTSLAKGEELFIVNQTVVVQGNDFDNFVTEFDLVPYITVSLTNSITNAIVKFTDISISTTGTVTANRSSPEIILAEVKQNYAIPDLAQKSTSGAIIGKHNVKIKAIENIPPGLYSLTFSWQADDGNTL